MVTVINGFELAENIACRCKRLRGKHVHLRGKTVGILIFCHWVYDKPVTMQSRELQLCGGKNFLNVMIVDNDSAPTNSCSLAVEREIVVDLRWVCHICVARDERYPGAAAAWRLLNHHETDLER